MSGANKAGGSRAHGREKPEKADYSYTYESSSEEEKTSPSPTQSPSSREVVEKEEKKTLCRRWGRRDVEQQERGVRSGVAYHGTDRPEPEGNSAKLEAERTDCQKEEEQVNLTLLD